jgi:hypothetical protein
MFQLRTTSQDLSSTTFPAKLKIELRIRAPELVAVSGVMKSNAETWRPLARAVLMVDTATAEGEDEAVAAGDEVVASAVVAAAAIVDSSKHLWRINSLPFSTDRIDCYDANESAAFRQNNARFLPKKKVRCITNEVLDGLIICPYSLRIGWGKHIITNQLFLSVHRKMILRSLEFMVFATYLARSLGSFQLPFRIAHEAVAQEGWNGVWTWI